MKLIRGYHRQSGANGRYRVIAFHNAFHGRTLADIAAGGLKKLQLGFEPLVDGFDHVPFGDITAVRAAVTERTGAILLEPVQGDGGIWPASPEFMQGLRRVADEQGLLLVLDEVQCGVGRTGRLFAHEWAGITPDVVAVAKGLGAGFPVGACLATAKVAAVVAPGRHGSTLGGNPLAMAVADAVLDVILEDGFLDQVVANGRALSRGMNEVAARHPGVIKAVRGVGLMLGLECVADNELLLTQLRKNGMLAASASNNVVRFLPPLIIGSQHVDEALDILERSCQQIAA